jgi:hypothetical protein
MMMSTAVDKGALIKTILSNTGRTLGQDSAALRHDIALWATWAQVLMRIGVAYTTPQQEPDKDKRHYAERQSAMTYFREFVGMTIGWTLLKALQKYFGKHTAEWAGYEQTNLDTNTPLGKGISQIKQVLCGKLTHVEPLADTIPELALWRRKDPKAPIKLGLVKMGYALEHPAPYLWKGLGTRFARWRAPLPKAVAKDTVKLLALEAKGAKFMHHNLPVALGSLPGLIIAGWGLERLTLHRADNVKDTVLSLMQMAGLAEIPDAAELKDIPPPSKDAPLFNEISGIPPAPLPVAAVFPRQQVGPPKALGPLATPNPVQAPPSSAPSLWR